jgi:hypothetical protein
LPKEWATDVERREAACIPDEVAFTTKPKIAIEMVATALDAGVPCAWVLGDAVYGSDKTLRVSLEEREKPYVLAVRGNEKLTMGDFHTYTARSLPTLRVARTTLRPSGAAAVCYASPVKTTPGFPSLRVRKGLLSHPPRGQIGCPSVDK